MIDNDHFVVADDGKADLVSGIKVLKGGSKNEIFELEIQDEEKALVDVAIDACPAECIKILG